MLSILRYTEPVQLTNLAVLKVYTIVINDPAVLLVDEP